MKHIEKARRRAIIINDDDWHDLGVLAAELDIPRAVIIRDLIAAYLRHKRSKGWGGDNEPNPDPPCHHSEPEANRE